MSKPNIKIEEALGRQPGDRLLVSPKKKQPEAAERSDAAGGILVFEFFNVKDNGTPPLRSKQFGKVKTSIILSQIGAKARENAHLSWPPKSGPRKIGAN